MAKQNQASKNNEIKWIDRFLIWFQKVFGLPKKVILNMWKYMPLTDKEFCLLEQAYLEQKKVHPEKCPLDDKPTVEGANNNNNEGETKRG